MRKSILIIAIVFLFLLIPSLVKALASTPSASVFNTQYDNMLSNSNVIKTMNCAYEDDDTATNMENNGIFQSLKEGSVEANAGSVSVSAPENPMCDPDIYPTAETNVQRKVTANYTIIQSGILDIDMDRGPLHSGGKYKFEISYVNTVRYYVEDVEQECGDGTVELRTYEPVTEKIYDNEGNEIGEELKKITICKGASDPFDESGFEDCEENGYQIITNFQECELSDDTVSVSYTCPEIDEEEAKEKAEAVAEDLINNLGNSDAVINVPSASNKVTSSGVLEDGEWQCDPIKKLVLSSSGNELIEVDAGTDLDSENEWVSRCKYKLDAKLDLNSANVFYNNNTTDSGIFKENENYYYIPLKYPSTDDEHPYRVTAQFSELSALSSINWSANYTCELEVKQLMYDLENGGFLFVYRPIILAMPFPNSGNNREPSKNWITWWENASNQDKLVASYGNLEYAINLSPTDMRNIKAYNDQLISNSGKNLGYLDYSINKNGTSNFSYVQAGRRTSDYNELGEYEGEDN